MNETVWTIRIDQERFESARQQVLGQKASSQGIGTLGEKILHNVLKFTAEPDLSCHERKVGSFVVDILNPYGIIEIQTRQFNKLRPKLTKFLSDYPVTIVYPIQARKWLRWVHPDTGELSERRLSPKRGNPTEAVYELYKIKPYLTHPNLRILICRIDLEEIRLLNGWSEDLKKGSTRADRIPLAFVDSLELNRPSDYLKLLPEGLGANFTSAEVAKAGKLSPKIARLVLNILVSLGQLVPDGKEGRRIRYRRIP